MLDALGRGVKIAETHRERRKHAGFLADLFQGKTSFDFLFPWPEGREADRGKASRIAQEFSQFLLERVDAEMIDQMRHVPTALVEELSRLGAFALKVPEERGGKELSQTGYITIIGLLASYSSAIAILVSADNTIGAKFPVMRYGTEEQKERYLPELIKWPSGFCFTERLVGSDPARMRTYALRVRNEKNEVIGYRMSGEKWYTTNSARADSEPLAEYLAVVARIVDAPEEVETSDCFGIFIISTRSPGVSVGPRNEFCGMRGIYNANPIFKDVFIGKNQLIGKEGEGFRIALEALNTGRIAIAAGCVATAKQALAASRWWAQKREQWGKPIGQHEAVGSGMLVPAAYWILAIEAMTQYASSLADRGEDARLAAAAAKVVASERSWTIIDNLMQIFGGRGYETYSSLSLREETVPVERIFRDARPNRIFEGSTQILSQWFMREGMDQFIKSAAIFQEKGRILEKLKVIFRFGFQYLALLKTQKISALDLPPMLRKHIPVIERNTRKFARALIFYAGRYRMGLVVKQLTMERFFWIAMELFGMSLTLSYARYVSKQYGNAPLKLADLFCKEARRRIHFHFRNLRNNDDTLSHEIAAKLLDDADYCAGYQFLENGVMRLIKKDG